MRRVLVIAMLMAFTASASNTNDCRETWEQWAGKWTVRGFAYAGVSKYFPFLQTLNQRIGSEVVKQLSLAGTTIWARYDGYKNPKLE